MFSSDMILEIRFVFESLNDIYTVGHLITAQLEYETGVSFPLIIAVTAIPLMCWVRKVERRPHSFCCHSSFHEAVSHQPKPLPSLSLFCTPTHMRVPCPCVFWQMRGVYTGMVSGVPERGGDGAPSARDTTASCPLYSSIHHLGVLLLNRAKDEE